MKITQQQQQKQPRDIIILHKSVPKIMIICYTLLEIYGVWRMKLLFFILGYFLPFYRPNSPKNQNFQQKKDKQEKTPGNILHMCTKNYD